MSIFEELADEDQYKPQDWSTEVVLVQSSVDLLCESILKQFTNPIEYGLNDFVQSFITKYTLSKKVDEEEESNSWENDETEDTEQLYDRFVSRVLAIFSNKIDIEIPEIDDMSHKDQLTMIHYVYLYFISHIRHNFLNYLRNYTKHKQEVILEKFKAPEGEHAGYYNDFVTDSYDLVLVTNMIDIAEAALADDSITCEEFLTWTMDEEGDLENEFVLEKYKACDIIGNFRKKYMALIEDDIVPIACNFQREITSKYHTQYDEDPNKALKELIENSLAAEEEELAQVENSDDADASNDEE